MLHSIDAMLEDRIRSAESPHIDYETRVAAYTALDKIRNNMSKREGAILVLGFNEKRHAKFVNNMDEDVIEKLGVKECKANIKEPFSHEIIYETLPYDGAILLDSKGYFLSSGMYLRPDPAKVLGRMHVGNHRPLGERFGFSEKVGTRHNNAIAASYAMPHSLIYCLSQESGKIRVFNRGHILYSPDMKEVLKPVEAAEIPAPYSGVKVPAFTGGLQPAYQ